MTSGHPPTEHYREDTATAARHAAAGEHASLGTYVKVAIILTIVTALEFGVISVQRLTPIQVPLLLVMSAAKFALVVMFFMHLRYDSRLLSIVFTGSLAIALAIGLALLTLPDDFLVLAR